MCVTGGKKNNYIFISFNNVLKNPQTDQVVVGPAAFAGLNIVLLGLNEAPGSKKTQMY